MIMLIYSKAQENILEKIVNTSFIEFIPQIIIFYWLRVCFVQHCVISEIYGFMDLWVVNFTEVYYYSGINFMFPARMFLLRG